MILICNIVIRGMEMNTNGIYSNSGSQVFERGHVRSPKDSERSGAVTTRRKDAVRTEKVKRYSVEVRDGALTITSPVRKVGK